MKITQDLFETFLKCPTKCWLRAADEPGSGNPYAEWARSQNSTYREAETERLLSETPKDKYALSPPAENLKAAKWCLAASLVVQTQMNCCVLESQIHAVERVPSEGRGRAAQFIPIRFIFTNKLGKDDKLLIAFDAFVLSELTGREISLGKIIHGDYHATLKVKTSALAGQVRKCIEKISALLSSPAPPDLILNRHCPECEFQSRCRQKAIEKDDLSLLSGMSEKERQKLRSKGIFTVTQLSYTFRPRRRSRRMRDKREKYHHSLKALAIRERKVHIVGNPELKIEGTPIYLDVEGLPDRDFYYLIGVRIGNGGSTVQHSLWADSVEDEGKIWREFLAILETVEKPVLIHYGSYETTFLERMRERYNRPHEGAPQAIAIQRSINLISVMFAQIYFPSHSNSLKDVAGWLGFKWSAQIRSGCQTIFWRHRWEEAWDSAKKQQLFLYNSEDCAACGLVAETILHVCSPTSSLKPKTVGSIEVAFADSIAPRETMWPRFSSPIDGFDVINRAARWDYQRNRIYIRTDRQLRQNKASQTRQSKKTGPVNKEVRYAKLRACPHCHRKATMQIRDRTKLVYDVRFTKFGVRRWVVLCHFKVFWCPQCQTFRGRPTDFWRATQYGRNLVAFTMYQVIELCLAQRSVKDGLNRLFGFPFDERVVKRLKESAADFYEQTRQRIVSEMIKGNLIHADETRIVLKGKVGYVWVLATLHEVAYFYAETREGDLLHKLLQTFRGVLVSDFYTAYDSVPCPQQKCLLHLMRDLNDAVLEQPYDDEVKDIVSNFANLLRSVVETIDQRGLKHYFLKKHQRHVERFYHQLSKTKLQSEAALKCRDRFEKNRDNLFTFLGHDGIPWNNNNVEHAIKAFARLRRNIEGLSTPSGIEEYLVLLSVCQTCKYMGVDFLDFLRSGEKDIHAFAKSRRGRGRTLDSGYSATVKSTVANVSELNPAGG